MGYRHLDATLSMQAREDEANTWAFKEMGIMDSQGKIKEKYRTCHECITRFHTSGEFIIKLDGRCLMGLNLNCGGKKTQAYC
jgi:hypothetical protein